LASFRTAYRFLKLWADRRGLISKELGFFSDQILIFLVAYACKSDVSAEADAIRLVQNFFQKYSDFKWLLNFVFDPSLYSADSPPQYLRARVPMVVLSVHTPVINVARLVNLDSLPCLTEELKCGNELMNGEATPLSRLVYGSQIHDARVEGDEPAMTFTRSFTYYVKFEFQYWGSSKVEGARVVDSISKKYHQLVSSTYRVWTIPS